MTSLAVSYNLNLGPDLPTDVICIARRHGEDPDKVCAYVQELKDMIYEKGEFNPDRTDSEFLLKFLRARFFKVENTYKLLLRYHEFRKANPDMHVNVRPLDLIALGEDDIVSVAPFKDQLGRRMMFHKIGNWKPSKISIHDILRTTMLLLEVGSLEPQAQVMGGVGIFDLEGLSISQAWYVNPTIAQKIIFLMTSMPHRTEEIHIINNGWAFDVVFQIFKPFLNERMRSRIFVHGSDLKSFHKHIHAEHLPQKYGGDMPPIDYLAWMESLMVNDKLIQNLQMLGYVFDESDRKKIQERKGIMT